MSPESKVIRVFVAIQLPETVRCHLAEVQRELKAVLPRGSTGWTRPENMHLTLRFLGNVATERVDELCRRLRAATASFGALHLRCERLGCFPDLRYPRVVWTWVHDTEERLAELHRCVDAAVGSFAEKPAESHFVGHVTLARPKQINRVDARRLAEFVESAVNRQFGAWECREVELVRSELSPAGSRYTTLDVFQL